MATKANKKDAQKERVLRVSLPEQIVLELKSRKKQYGELKRLAKKANIPYPSFYAMVDSKKATPVNIQKVQKALAA